jgi:hypothetical protein
MNIVNSCIREADGKYTLEITITVDDSNITLGPLVIPITKAQAAVLERAGVPSCSE